MNGLLFMSLLLLLIPDCFSSYVKMFSNGSVLVCLCSWSQRYCSAEICVGFMCCLSHVTNQPVSVMEMWYDVMILITFPFYHAMGPWSPIFLLNHYRRPHGDKNIILGSTFVFVIFHLPFYYCFMMFLSGQLIICIMPLIRQLNIIVAGLGILVPVGSYIFATGLCVDHPSNQSIFYCALLQILYMPLLVLYSDCGKMTRMSVLV